VAKEFERHAMLAWNNEDNSSPLPPKTSGGVGNDSGSGMAANPSSSGSVGGGIGPQEKSVKAVYDFAYVELPEDGPARWIQL
jgi:hypothetical protein